MRYPFQRWSLVGVLCPFESNQAQQDMAYDERQEGDWGHDFKHRVWRRTANMSSLGRKRTLLWSVTERTLLPPSRPSHAHLL